MLKEDKGISQNEEGVRRRWFTDDNMDLIVWYKPTNHIFGFQVCYDRQTNEHALTWKETDGFHHNLVDSGEEGPEENRSPVLAPDGLCPFSRLAAYLRQNQGDLEKPLFNFILEKVREAASSK